MSHAMMIFPGLLVVCFVIRMSIAIGMIMSSTLYLVVRSMSPSAVVEVSTGKMYNNFILLAVPLFIFAADIINSSKVTDKIFDFSKVLVGRWRGDLGHVNVTAFLIFSGMTDSAVADASGLGIMEIKVTRKGRYDDGFNAAITAGSAVIDPISPPSIPLVVYRVVAGTSIDNLFLAGIVPGIILALALYIYTCYIVNKRNHPSGRKYAGTGFIKITMGAVPVLLTPIILPMGIYIGTMTTIEVGTMAALYTLLISVFVYRSITLSEFIQILKNTVKPTGQTGIMLSAAYVFSYVIAVENLPSLVGNLILPLATTKVSLLVSVDILLFILGILLDSAVLQLVLLPILCPITQSFGIDIVHFGVVFTLNTMIGLCIPPFSMPLFIMTGISGERVNTIIKEVMPMVSVMVLVLILVTFMPDVIMWLSRLFGQ